MSVNIARSASTSSSSSSTFSERLSMARRWTGAPKRFTAARITLPALMPSASKWVTRRTGDFSAANFLLTLAASPALFSSSRWRSSLLLERGSNWLVLPFLRKPAYAPVVDDKPVNLRLDQGQIPLVGIVFPVLLKVPSNTGRLFHKIL